MQIVAKIQIIMKMNNRIVVDLNKVQYAWYGYRNQHNQKIPVKPISHTVNGLTFTCDDMHISGICSMLEYAKQNNLLDVWEPYVEFQIQANHRLTYTGDKAVSMWKAWNEKIFNKKKK